AVRDARAGLEESKRAMSECIEALDKLEALCKKAKNQSELALLRSERGFLRTLVGIILRNLPGEQGISGGWLRPAALDFAAAIDAAKEEPTREMSLLQIRAAMEGRRVAAALGDRRLLAQFDGVIESFQSSEDFAEDIEALEAADDGGDLLNRRAPA